jgi:hypothetical protein
MKRLLSTAVFLVVAAAPLVLKGQSLLPVAGSSDRGAWGLWGFGGPRTVVFPPFFGYPANYPFTYFYPSLWPPLDVQYQQASRIANGDVEAEVAAQEKEYLASKVQALTNEVQSLRQQQAYSPYTQPATGPPRAGIPQEGFVQPTASARQDFPETVFIYRDGQEMPVRDYAIFGNTLWVFNGQVVHKFPLAEFNLAASRKVNEQHGVEFPLSGRH